MKPRSNAEWIAALESEGGDQTAALAALRAYLLRAALFTLERSRHYVGHLGSSALAALAEDCAQESMTAVLQRLGDFRGVVEIQMRATARGEEVWFDPIGLWVPSGQTVRWVLHHDVHTTTAYHPKNDHHSLRIPEGATPWDSGFLVKPGAHFDVTFTVEGVYDYYCLPHEQAGMVGRIIVGRPDGPGALPFDYFKGRPDTASWKPVPDAAQKAFPGIEHIMATRIVRRAESG